MPRRPRMYLPGVPAHIVQRGNNRGPCFFAEEDYSFYLDRLQRALRRYRVACHAYVLMTNHVHLLLTPSSAEGISRVMAWLGQQYVRHVNQRYRRSGTLWEGRHKGSIIDSERYLFVCYRYIELNPVRAGMVASPGDYLWSSYRRHAWNIPDPLIQEHELYRDLGRTAAERQLHYRGLFREALEGRDVHAVDHALDHNYPLGNDRFRTQIEAALKIQVGHMTAGRPRKEYTLSGQN